MWTCPIETAENKQLYEVQDGRPPVRFMPEFLLEGHAHMQIDPKTHKIYPDRVIPVAVAADPHAGGSRTGRF